MSSNNKYLESHIIQQKLSSSKDKETFLDKAKSLNINFQDLELQEYLIHLGINHGIDVKEEIQAISDSIDDCTESVKQRKANKAKIETIQRVSNNLSKLCDAKETKVESLLLIDDVLDESIFDLQKARKNTSASPSYTFDNFIKYWKEYDPSKEFRPNLFNKQISFPNGTLSYIGARPHRGKTAAIVNLAREGIALNRRVIICTLETPPNTLIDNLILSTMFQKDVAESRKSQSEQTRTSLPKQNLPKQTEKCIYNEYMRDCFKNSFNEHANTAASEQVLGFSAYAKETLSHIKKLMSKEQVVIYDFIHGDFRTIRETIKCVVNEGDVVLIDYIQLMPAVDRKDDGYRRVQNISRSLFTLANDTGGIFVSAAQFARGGFNKDGYDKFDETSFRESGDLEQDAHNAIGIGWNEKDKTKLIFEILKARDSGAKGSAYHLSTNLQYCYMECGACYAAEKQTVVASIGSSIKGKKLV